jgi:predicted acetyltransferase
MREIETRRATDPDDLEALAPIVGWAFGGGTSRALDWLRGSGGAPQVRVACLGGRVSGGLLEIPMGQWFGGKNVPTLGLAGVAIAPEARGQGLALGLLRATLRAARERGVALSTLYPSTFRLYRKAGYELAGSFCRFTLQLRQLPRSLRLLPVEVLGESLQPSIEGAYRDVARQHPGYLDRGPYVWNRVRRPDLELARAFGVSGPSGLEGYAYLKVTAPRRLPLELGLSDFVSRTPAALASLLAFLADHLTTAERATWTGGPCDPRLLGIPERAISAVIEDYWMLRLIDVKAALLARGYPEFGPPGLEVALDLHVDDEFLPENSARYALRVEAGVARLEAPGSGSGSGAVPLVRLSAGALAALYSGFVSPAQLAFSRQLDADARGVGVLSALFSGAAPGLSDFF